jgi:hypothetical protein
MKAFDTVRFLLCRVFSTSTCTTRWHRSDSHGKVLRLCLYAANQAHRRHMPHRSMCAFWTLNEPWPNAAYGSVIDWFGVKKAAYYAATRKVYSHTDVSLTYSNLFLVAGEALPHISPWVVAENR